MLLLISPAKTLDMQPQPLSFSPEQPLFLQQSAELIEQLRQLTLADLAQLMGISDKLAGLNLARYQAWSAPFDAHNAKPAALAFRGDVYDGLNADDFCADNWHYAQQHLRILSGLYGLLRPQDWMQAYRLEMGTQLATKGGKDLYQFWGSLLAEHLRHELNQQPLINLASNEYFKAVQSLTQQQRVIQPVFKDWSHGQYKIISFYAKKARGLMCRYAIKNQLQQAEQLQAFDYDGYAFALEQSTNHTWVFLRRLAD